MSLSEATVKKPEREKPVQSKTVKASAATIAASAGTTITALAKVDQTSQYIILGFAGLTILFALVIMRERLKAWAEPDAHQIASNQVIYQDEETCEAGRMNLLARLEATRPAEGRVFIKCVEILGGRKT
jgi:hypothetical protein